MLDHRLLVNPPGGGVVVVEGEVVAVVKGSSLAEQQTQADATAGVLTFAAPISFVSIYNTDASNAGVFEVNGIDVHVPAGDATQVFGVGGTPSATVTVTGATTYIVSRFA